MCKCIVVAEGHYEGTYSFDTPEELFVFIKGIEIGSGLYGAGSCIVATDEDLGEFGENVDELIRKHLLI